MKVLIAFEFAARGEFFVKNFMDSGLKDSSLVDMGNLPEITAPTVLVVDGYARGYTENLKKMSAHLEKSSHPTLTIVFRGVVGENENPLHSIIEVGGMGFEDDVDCTKESAKEFFSRFQLTAA